MLRPWYPWCHRKQDWRYSCWSQKFLGCQWMTTLPSSQTCGCELLWPLCRSRKRNLEVILSPLDWVGFDFPNFCSELVPSPSLHWGPLQISQEPKFVDFCRWSPVVELRSFCHERTLSWSGPQHTFCASWRSFLAFCITLALSESSPKSLLIFSKSTEFS